MSRLAQLRQLTRSFSSAPGDMSAQITRSLPQGLYKKDVTYEKLDGSINELSIQTIVRELVPGVQDSAIEIAAVTGGITNLLFKVSFSCQAPSVLVRVFGAEGMIERDLENATYVELANAGVAPLYYGRFGNGRVEGFLDAKELALEDMADAEISLKIAREMAKLHAYELSPALQAHYSEPGLWPQVWTWFEQAKGNEENLRRQLPRFDDWREQLLGSGFAQAADELQILEQALGGDNLAVFAHNDLLAGNIIVERDSGKLQLIDFEYGGCNYRGFDIANHWSEWAGGTQEHMNGRPEYFRFPTDEQQKAFCRAYIETRNSLTGAQSSQSDMENESLSLQAESQKFVLVNHWYWGLWAVNQAFDEGVENFDYLTYSQARLERYYEEKETLTLAVNSKF